MDPSLLLVFAGALLVAAGSPGPSIAALVSRVLTRGFRDGLPFLAAKWLGEVLWLTPATVDPTTLAADRSPVRMFFAGLAVTLGNPKIMVFSLALLPSLIDLRAITLLGWAELALTLLVVLIAIDLTWSLLAVKARTFLRTPGAVRAANRASATQMTGAAVAFATR